MKMQHTFIGALVASLMVLGAGQLALAADFSNELQLADSKVTLGHEAEAEMIYKRVISGSEASVTRAYAHYKLGTLYRKQQSAEKAAAEFEQGLRDLNAAGAADHQIGKYLAQAIASPGW